MKRKTTLLKSIKEILYVIIVLILFSIAQLILPPTITMFLAIVIVLVCYRRFYKKTVKIFEEIFKAGSLKTKPPKDNADKKV